MNTQLALVILGILAVLGWMHSTATPETQLAIWEFFKSFIGTVVGGGVAGGVAGFWAAKRA